MKSNVSTAEAVLYGVAAAAALMIVVSIVFTATSYETGAISAQAQEQPEQPDPPQASWEWASEELGIRRTRTPQGWLVQRHDEIVYIPDPGHEWLAPRVEAE